MIDEIQARRQRLLTRLSAVERRAAHLSDAVVDYERRTANAVTDATEARLDRLIALSGRANDMAETLRDRCTGLSQAIWLLKQEHERPIRRRDGRRVVREIRRAKRLLGTE